MMIHDLITKLSAFLDEFEAKKCEVNHWSRCMSKVNGHDDTWIYFTLIGGLRIEHYKIEKSVILNDNLDFPQKWLSAHVM